MPNDDLRLRAIIQKRLTERVARSLGEVTVRDIIVIGQEDGTIGEFANVSVYHKTPDTLYRESESDVIHRMLIEISLLADCAAKYHLEDNFIASDKNKMREDKQNAITRLTFNEFYFYPSSKRGPLSSQGFKALMEEIETLGKGLPENLHLILSSFPVMDDNKNVHNMVIHVQCGLMPRLYSFAKSVPSEKDIEYPGTATPFFIGGYKTNGLQVKIDKLSLRIENNLKLSPPIIDRASLERLRGLVNLVPVSETHLTIMLIDKLLKSGVDRPELVKHFRDTMALLSEQIEAKGEAAKKSVISAAKKEKIKTVKLPAKDSFNPAINYSSIVSCVTYGGVHFTTAIEICLDHFYELARRFHAHSMRYHLGGVQLMMPTQISQVVTSNTVALVQAGVFAGSVVHADPARHQLLDRQEGGAIDLSTDVMKFERQKEWSNSAFGSKSRVMIYPVRPLARVGLELGEVMEKVNALNLLLQTLLPISQHYPDREAIRQQIKDIKLRMALMVKDYEKIKPLIDDGASLLYEGEDGVSSLALARKDKDWHAFLKTGSELHDAFGYLIMMDDHRGAVAFYEQVGQLGLTRKIKNLIQAELSLAFKFELFHLAVRERDVWLLMQLQAIGLSPIMVDPVSQRALYNEILILKDDSSEMMRQLTKIFNDYLRDDLLIESLNDVDDVDQAKRLLLAAAIDADNDVLFKTVINLGGDCLGVNPVTGITLLSDLPVMGLNDITSAVFQYVIDHDIADHYIKIVLENHIPYLKVVYFLKYVLALEGDHARSMGHIIDGLIDGNKYAYLGLIKKDKTILSQLPDSLQNKVMIAVDAFGVFQEALRNNDIRGVEASLKAGMSPNVILDERITPLASAIFSNNMELIDVLLSYHPDLNLSDDSGHASLYFAIQFGNWPAIEHIRAYCEKQGLMDAIFDASALQFIESEMSSFLVQVISNSYANDFLIAELDDCFDLSKTLGIMLELNSDLGVQLMKCAIQSNNPAIAHWLLDKGVNANGLLRRFVPLLSYAIKKQSSQIAKLLIASGADPLLEDGRNRTPFYYAITSGNAVMTSYLIELNPGSIDLNKNEESLDLLPLHYAVENKDEKVAEVLLNNGADPNSMEEEFGITPLISAVDAKDLSMVKVLLSQGADPNLTTDKWSPLTYALKRKAFDIVQALLLHPQLDVNKPQPKTQRSALFLAVLYNNSRALNALLKAGANPALADVDGVTPLMLADELDRHNFVEALQSLKPVEDVKPASRSRRPG